MINSVKKTNRLIIVEETWPFCSVGTELAYNVQKDAFDYLDAPVRRITQADTPLPFAPTLIEASLPTAERVIRATRDVLYMN